MRQAGWWVVMMLSAAAVEAAPRAAAEAAQQAEESVPAEIRERAESFLASQAGHIEFSEKRILRYRPIHAQGVRGVAYYEVWLTDDGATPAGWLMLSNTEQDYPLVNFSHNGQPYSLRVAPDSREASGRKVYRFGGAYFTAEDSRGQLVAEYGNRPRLMKPSALTGSGSTDRYEPLATPSPEEAARESRAVSYAELRQVFGPQYFTPERARVASEHRARALAERETASATATDPYNYKWISYSWAQTRYQQIPANTAPNNNACWSGCQNNAWANIYGWWDQNMGKSALVPTNWNGETTSPDRNTAARASVVDPIQMWVHARSGTYCNGSDGWTLWRNGWRGAEYPYFGVGYGYRYQYRWCDSTGCNGELKTIAQEALGVHYTPAHVGANAHFYVAYGLAEHSTNSDWVWVYGYPGWNTSTVDDVWIFWRDLNSTTLLLVY